MKLAEALRIVQSADPSATEFPLWLVSGSTPEPLSHFLAAHLQQRLPGRRVRVETGRFGVLADNLERYLERGAGPAAVVLEWADLDPRLGLRQAGGWGRAVTADILATVESRLNQLCTLLARAEARTIVLVPPTLPLPPVLPVAGWQLNALEAGLQRILQTFLASVVSHNAVRVLAPERLAAISPAGQRLDVKAWLSAGFPYCLAHASALAELLACALAPAVPAKGIITDLDNTLWSGILGEIGAPQVAWDLEHHAAMHGIYQQFLQSLADDGVLVGIASKNDRALVEEVFRRPDILLRAESVFPLEVHWQPKSDSAARILKAWNIAPDSVVFLDDSPMEVAEMQAAFPSMDCRLFPGEDPDALLALFAELADRFGKPAATEEDRLRRQSLRAAEYAQAEMSGTSHEQILRSAEGVLTLARLCLPPDPRALELVNKTNQFNLNGKRYTEAEWLDALRGEGGCAWIASYRDKFGPLGKIAVIAGARCGHRLRVNIWVLSCRAFSRHIEHAFSRFLFEHEHIDELVLDYKATERNGPVQEFLSEVTGEAAVAGPVTLSRSGFAARTPEIYVKVECSE